MPFDSVRIEVRDTGMGMDEETQARIFEAFFSTKTQKGTGLGLWVSHGIVQGHGGAMKARSRIGEGTTFIIVLPVAGPPESPRPRRPPFSSSTTRRASRRPSRRS